MEEPLSQCQNCSKLFPESKVDLHFAYCRRNIRKCDKCSEMVDINHLEEHMEEFHTDQPCPHCTLPFPQNQLSLHKEICEQQPVVCEYCEQSIPVASFTEHHDECGSRTQKCEKCQSPILYRNYNVHIVTCEGKKTQSQLNYINYINREREKMNLPPKHVVTTTRLGPSNTTSTTITTTTIPTKVETVRVSAGETKPGQPAVIRHEVKELGTRVIETRREVGVHDDEDLEEFYDDYHSSHFDQPVVRTAPVTRTYTAPKTHNPSGFDEEDPEFQIALMQSLGYN